MEAVIFIGIQGAGKSTFYQRHFFHSHLRLNLDQLKTRPRLNALLATCLATGTPFVWDLTNAARAERAQVLALAKTFKFRVVGYFFVPDFEKSLARNATRQGRARVPDVAIKATVGRLEKPSFAEGFDALFAVEIEENGEYLIENWPQL